MEMLYITRRLCIHPISNEVGGGSPSSPPRGELEEENTMIYKSGGGSLIGNYLLTHSYSLTYLLTHSLTLTHPPIHSLTHSYSLTYSLTHSLTHSLTYSLAQ